MPSNPKNQICPPFAKIQKPRTKEQMKERQVREALVTVLFREAKIAPVLGNSTTLEIVKNIFTIGNLFLFNPSTVCTYIRHTGASVSN